uniref:hypothetical protein n=1 Tax=Anaerovibrio lipolyticus TaxID=82374 RepID=UPI001E642555
AEASVPSAVSNDTGRNYTIPDEKHNRFYVPLFTYIYVLFGCVFPFLSFISLSRGKCYKLAGNNEVIFLFNPAHQPWPRLHTAGKRERSRPHGIRPPKKLTIIILKRNI